MVFHNFDELIAKVKGAPDKKIMAVACANDDHTLEAVVNARREGIIEPLLVGDKKIIHEILEKLGESIPEENIFDVPEDDADSVRAYMQPMVRRLHAELLSPTVIYGDAKFNNINSNDDVTKLKRIWNNRPCVFIEGVHTCMGVGNDLFDNCRSIERILGPAENAIDKYDEILTEALKQPKDKLFLIALGPTATVLAYDLCKEGYQAIDLGHADLAYEAFISSAPNMYSVNIPYKYCSRDERVSGRIIEPADDPEYTEQILRIIQ